MLGLELGSGDMNKVGELCLENRLRLELEKCIWLRLTQFKIGKLAVTFIILSNVNSQGRGHGNGTM